MIGIILYGFVNNVKEKSSELEKQISKNEYVSQGSVKFDLENEPILNKNVKTKTKEELKTHESTMEINHLSFKLEIDENKNNLTNEIILQENEEFIKLEKHEITQNLENKTITQKEDETKIKEKLNKYEPEQQISEINRVINFLETVPKMKNSEEKTIKSSKEKKQMKRKIDKKQNKIMNAIEQILLESDPSLDDKKSLFYNKIIALKKNEYRLMVDMLKQHMQAQENESLLLNIKVCLENKNTLIAGTGNKYFISSKKN
jgi:hypothetical protein